MTGDKFDFVVDKFKSKKNDFAPPNSLVSFTGDAMSLDVSNLKFSPKGITVDVVVVVNELSEPDGLVPLVVFTLALIVVSGVAIGFGIDYISFVHEEVENTVTTYPSAKVDLGIEFVTERIEPQGDPINSAGIDVNEGTFTLSSAVKLNVDFALQPEIDIPLLTRYHLVKYMIRAY